MAEPQYGCIPVSLIHRFHELTKTEITVVCYLYACRNPKTLRCDPSYGRMVEHLGIHKANIGRAVRSLLEKKFIGRNTDAGYVLGGSQFSPPQGSQSDHSRVVNLTPKGSQSRNRHIMDKQTKNKQLLKSKPIFSVEDLITEYSGEPAYIHIDVPHEAEKAQKWIKDHEGRRFTKRFFTSWLDRIERPLASLETKPEPTFALKNHDWFNELPKIQGWPERASC